MWHNFFYEYDKMTIANEHRETSHLGKLGATILKYFVIKDVNIKYYAHKKKDLTGWQVSIKII